MNERRRRGENGREYRLGGGNGKEGEVEKDVKEDRGVRRKVKGLFGRG